MIRQAAKIYEKIQTVTLRRGGVRKVKVLKRTGKGIKL